MKYIYTPVPIFLPRRSRIIQNRIQYLCRTRRNSSHLKKKSEATQSAGRARRPAAPLAFAGTRLRVSPPRGRVRRRCVRPDWLAPGGLVRGPSRTFAGLAMDVLPPEQLRSIAEEIRTRGLCIVDNVIPPESLVRRSVDAPAACHLSASPAEST